MPRMILLFNPIRDRTLLNDVYPVERECPAVLFDFFRGIARDRALR